MACTLVDYSQLVCKATVLVSVSSHSKSLHGGLYTLGHLHTMRDSDLHFHNSAKGLLFIVSIVYRVMCTPSGCFLPCVPTAW